MSGTSIGHTRPRPCSGKKTLRKCRNKEKTDKVILIDVDSGIYDNVVIIDVPETFPTRNQDSHKRKKDKKWLFNDVINLDDDETPESSSPLGANSIGFSARTSKESFRVAEEFGNSKDVQDSATPVRLSKCKRTYSGKATTSNRYGLDTDSECELYDNDQPDCELMEDFSGKFQELWEKAVSRRRKDIRSGVKVHDSTSNSINKDHQNAESSNASRHHEEASFFHTSEKPDKKNGSTSPVRTENDDFGGKSKSAADCTNCELFAGKFQEFWEKAVSRRRKDIHAGVKVHGSTSSSINEDHQNAESKNASRHHEEASFFHTSEKPDNKIGSTSPVRTENNDFGGESKSVADCTNCELGSSSRRSERQKHQAPSNFFHQEETNKKFDHHISTAGHKENAKDEDKDAQPFETGHSSSPVNACITNERERLKETDEYRRAMEQEWASRKEALQAQAEEAQLERKLRKRRKAETMRLQDMEQRQKQRLDEMRSIKKQDEENMNLKEKLRAVVRNQLKTVEVGCQNMASLLHSLGLKVGSWPTPSPQEVQAAYKRALLTFHPDRASQSDIRQMVEAEEKFKLINRMKEKFPPSL